MRVQTAEVVIPDIGTIITIPTNDKTEKEYKVEEKHKIKSELSYIKNQNKVLIHIESIIKRLIDICAGVVGMIFLIPLTIIVYMINKISGDGKQIFYSQERIGKDGKLFKMYKFRSMVPNADEKLSEYLNENEEARREYKKYKKLKNDPRVTKVGKFLRSTSLDELPQLVNLITGEMTLVGPRPYLPREKEDMGEYYNIIVKYKPGITGLWQVSGRSNTTFDDRLDMDIKYHKKYSLKCDIEILYATAKNVLKREGAL